MIKDTCGHINVYGALNLLLVLEETHNCVHPAIAPELPADLYIGGICGLSISSGKVDGDWVAVAHEFDEDVVGTIANAAVG